MDGITLLRRARDAGLRIEPVGDTLLIRGPKRAEPVVKLLAEHKHAILSALASTQSKLASPPWFDSLPESTLEGEPALEQPCATRRGRVQETDGQLLHFCVANFV